MKTDKTIYHKMTSEQLEEHLSGYLVRSISNSALNAYCSNELLFLKEYAAGERGKSRPSGIAGRAYHKALEKYFKSKKDKKTRSLDELLEDAYEQFKNTPADEWMCGKTNPTIEDCVLDATKKANACVQNFCTEISAYDFIAEILEVELKVRDFLIINGVEVPLPFSGVMDLVVRDKDGKFVIVDHKTTTVIIDEKTAEFEHAMQAIIYTKLWENFNPDKPIDRVVFAFNKASKNSRQNAAQPQIQSISIPMDADNRTLYEVRLYEPVKRFVEAVGNPDYLYLPNFKDKMCDQAELLDFWMRTQISEVGDFPLVSEHTKSFMKRRKQKIRDSSISNISPKAIEKFATHTKSFISFSNISTMKNTEKIEHRLKTYNIPAQVVAEQVGYSSTTFLLEVQAGVPISSVRKYRLDLANALGVEDVRIPKNLVAHNGATYLAVEAPRVFAVGDYPDPIDYDSSNVDGEKLPVGVMNDGNTLYWDMGNHSMPHGVVCGATGSGKSVFLKTILESFRIAYPDSEIVILDPKYEFGYAKGFAEVINDIEAMQTKVEGLVLEMNERVKKGEKKMTLLLFDEIADAYAMANSYEKNRKEDVQIIQGPRGGIKEVKEPSPTERSLKENIMLILQKGRSSGYRCILATQRATAELLDGNAKVNLPVQICFKVPKAIDSQVVLDEEGAELLRGMGDGLMRSPLHPNPVRFQSFFTK